MWRRSRAILLAIGVLIPLGCASTVQEWVKPGAGRVSRLAVLPFENQTTSLRAGQAVADLLVSEILATGAMPVMDPSEVADVLRRDNLDPTDASRLSGSAGFSR
jgi:hypothetical protein